MGKEDARAEPFIREFVDFCLNILHTTPRKVLSEEWMVNEKEFAIMRETMRMREEDAIKALEGKYLK